MTNDRRIDLVPLAAGTFAALAASLFLRHLGIMECWIECILFLSLP